MSPFLQFASILLTISLLSIPEPVSALNCGAGQCTLPSFPMCAQIPAQDALLYGNCPTTDFACVCADPDKVATFLNLLRLSCSPPKGSENAYQTSLRKLIDLCAKKGYDVTGLVQGFASTATISSATSMVSIDPLASSMAATATTSLNPLVNAGASSSSTTAAPTATATLVAVGNGAGIIKRSSLDLVCVSIVAAMIVAGIVGY